jgi:large subunit ribosomal protein L9
MVKELILMKDVDGLGVEGKIVKVSDGYARNYLLPNKFAVPVTQSALKRLEKNKIEREDRQRKELEGARQLAETIEKLSCTIAVKVGEGEKIFGSVNAIDIQKNLKEQGIEIDRKKILLSSAIKELGIYSVKIRLHPEVEAVLKVWVVGE